MPTHTHTHTHTHTQKQESCWDCILPTLYQTALGEPGTHNLHVHTTDR